MKRPYQCCTRCIMDTTVPSIQFSAEGVCNFCEMHDEMDARYPLNDVGKQRLNAIVADIKKAGEGKKYDVVCGTSGGRDSTWVLYVAVKMLGLRPLVIHFDNGWNSAIAGGSMVIGLDLVIKNIRYLLTILPFAAALAGAITSMSYAYLYKKLVG